MSKYLLGFPNKKERDDFLIAILVILFFGWIMSRFVGCGKDNQLELNNDAVAEVTKTVALGNNADIDTDGDGIVDTKDKCPTIAGLALYDGCLPNKDSDGDGVYDHQDKCPQQAGKKKNDGCPADYDGDGIYDRNDRCPYVKGPKGNAGCPKAAKDTDGDGVIDRNDKCPELAGVIANGGCPADQDGDGVYDKNDKCPTVKGILENGGCPPVKDSDGDGVNDNVDKCPKVAGVAANNGCPSDRDGDGVYDKDDRCPDKKGLKNLAGCPAVKVEEAEAKTLEEAVQAVEFETASARLKTSSKVILKKVIAIMKKYPKAKIDIIGHTDNIGNDIGNQKLSEARARACANYFIKKGIDEKRIQHEGRGENQPIATNENAEGRSQNRRVEFNLHY